MDIAAMSIMLSQCKVQQQAGILVMKMAMDVEAANGDAIASLASEMTMAMESSVHPNLGAIVDIRV